MGDERNNMRSSLVFIAALAAFTVAHEDSWDQVTEVQSSDAVLYKVQGNVCGQVTIDAKYASEAEKFAGLKEGTCSSAGFTVADGTKSIKVPVIGNVNVSKFKKASLMANPAISCLKSKCSSQYSSCQGDSVCKSVMSCVEPCSDSSCALKCVKPHIFNPKVASLGACGGKNGCWSSTAEQTFPMAVPSGTYKGTTKELGVTVKATITIDDTSHADIAVVASGIVSVNVNCKKEAYQLASSGKVSLPGQGKSGDCIHDSLQKYSVDLKSVQYDSSSDSIELSVHKIVSIKVKLSKNSLSMEYDRAKFKKASLMANPAIACLKSKCSSQYSSCQGDSVCKSVVSCVEPCSDSSCALKCVKPHIFNPKVASLGACGGKNGCWSSTAEETFPMAVPSGTYKGTTKEL